MQDAFVALHGTLAAARDPDRALAYLRRSVVNGVRSAQRHRGVERTGTPRPRCRPPPAPSTGRCVALEHAEVLAALRTLPPRQREVLVLRYYVDLSEADIAEALGISRGAVKSHASRGMAALRLALETTA